MTAPDILTHTLYPVFLCINKFYIATGNNHVYKQAIVPIMVNFISLKIGQIVSLKMFRNNKLLKVAQNCYGYPICYATYISVSC